MERKGRKPKGRHPVQALTPITVKKAREPGRYADGGGLYLLVEPSGAKRWVLRVRAQGRRRDVGLGGLDWVPLAEAREEAAKLRRVARTGGDPIAERNRARRVVPTFAEAAKAVHVEHAKGWKGGKHQTQWMTTLEKYAFPRLGTLRVDHIGSQEVFTVLSPIWLAKPETARRVRQRVSTVMDWAKANGHRSGDNPVDLADIGLPKQTDRVQHHDALAFDQVPDFIGELRAFEAQEATRLAFELLILTVARTGELIAARPAEFDLDGERIWTCPAERMKAKRDHRVPLSDRAIEIVRRLKVLAGGSEWLLPGRGSKHLSNMVFLALLGRMGREITAHGFRSSFRDWAAEKTNFPREVVEMALAHTIEDKVEAAYRRGDLLQKRRQLAEAWTRFATGEHGKVVAIRRAAE